MSGKPRKELPNVRIGFFRQQLRNRQSLIDNLHDEGEQLKLKVARLEQELATEQEQTRIQTTAISDLEKQLEKEKETSENVGAQLRMARERADLAEQKLLEAEESRRKLQNFVEEFKDRVAVIKNLMKTLNDSFSEADYEFDNIDWDIEHYKY
jgi:chromosome segregation ATPase